VSNDGPIPITPPGTATTDPFQVESLKALSPKGHLAAQNLLVATQKLVHRKGFLSSHRSRHERVARRLIDLENALRSDGLTTSVQFEGAAQFLARFARAYPNWQSEYRYLNELLPEIEW